MAERLRGGVTRRQFLGALGATGIWCMIPWRLPGLHTADDQNEWVCDGKGLVFPAYFQAAERYQVWLPLVAKKQLGRARRQR